MIGAFIRNKKLAIRVMSLGDQACFSAGNFLLTIMLAKFYPETDMAGYGIGLSIAMTLQGIQRSLYMVQNSVLQPNIVRRRATRVMGQQCVIWVVLFGAECVALITWSLWKGDSEYFRAIACATIVCTLIYIQLDFDRIMMIKHERFVDPLIISVGFLILNGALFFMIPRWHLPFVWTMSLLGLYALIKSLWLVFAIGPPDFFWGWRLFLRDLKRYLAASLIGAVGYSGYSNFPIFILGSVAAPIQSAAFGAMRGLMQPLVIVVRSLDMVDKNFFQKGGNSPAAMRHTFFRLFAAYGALSLFAILMLAIFGHTIVHLAYGPKYERFSNLVIGWGLIFGMLAITSPLETVIVRLNRINLYNLYRIPAGIVGIILALLLCRHFEAWGAIIACLGGWLTSVACAFWLIWPILFPGRFKT